MSTLMDGNVKLWVFVDTSTPNPIVEKEIREIRN